MLDVTAPANDQERWAHPNRLGSTGLVSDALGAAVETHAYAPYGAPGAAGPGGFPYRFTGQRLDPESGLYFYKARYYDPELGRFLQTDPIGYADQMNLYAYVGNDPVNATDPTGRQGSSMQDNGLQGGDANTYTVYVSGDHATRRGGARDEFDVAILAAAARAAAPAASAAAAADGALPLGDIVALAMVSTAVYAVLPPDVQAQVDDQLYFALSASGPLDPMRSMAAAAAVDGLSLSAAKIHGNTYASPRPTWVYALVSHRTGEILKYGITSLTVPEGRYPGFVYTWGNMYMHRIQAHPNRLNARKHEINLCVSHIVNHGARPPLSVVC